MAGSPGTLNDFVIYSPQFWGGVIETLQQNTEAFNGASMNTIRMVTRSLIGEYEKESFLKSTSSIVARRDPTSTAAADIIKLAQGEFVGVKLNRRLGPVDQTRDSFRKIGVDPKEFSVMLGQQAGVAIAVDYINIAISAVAAAIAGNANLIYDHNGTATGSNGDVKTSTHTALVNGTALFGDKASRLLCFVMHSKPYFDLVKQTLVDKIVNVADVTIYQGNVATLGKPTVVLDSPSLMNTVNASPTLTTYDVLALTENAVEVTESEERDILSQPVTGLENLVDRIQGEYAFNLRVKGCAYNTSVGANPTDANVALSTTWTQLVADKKDMPGTKVIVA